MHKATKAILIIAACFIIVGGILAGVGYALGGFTPMRLTSEGPQLISSSASAEISVSPADIKAAQGASAISEIEVNAELASIVFEEGSDFAIRGRYNPTYTSFSWKVAEGILSIDCKQEIGSPWLRFDLGFLQNQKDEIVITYPQGTQLASLVVTTNMGSIEAPALNAEHAEFLADMGSLTLRGLNCGDLIVNLNMGSADLRGCVATGSSNFDLDMGSLTILDSDLANLDARCDMGSFVYGGKLSGTAYVNLSMGDASLKLSQPLSSISYELNCDLGSVSINGRDEGNRESAQAAGAKALELTIDCNMGSITVRSEG